MVCAAEPQVIDVLNLLKQRAIPAAVLLSIVPILALGPALHVHAPGQDCQGTHSAVAHAADHICTHHGHSDSTHNHGSPHSPSQAPDHHHDGPQDHGDCVICLVLAQCAETPQTVTTADCSQIFNWSLTLQHDQCPSFSRPSLQARGPPA